MSKYFIYDDEIKKNIKANMKKFTNTFIISVDGVDGAGKSTFISNLKTKLEKVLDTDKVDITIQHFPNYAIDSGKDIKEMLMSCKDPFDPSFILSMTDINMLNRYETICEYEPDEDKKFHTILLDRYKSSNDFFNIMKYTYNADGDKDNNRDEYRDIIMAHLDEIDEYCTPEPDLQIFTTIDEELQLERLSKKSNKDKFENADNIRFVNKLFSKYIEMRLPLKYRRDKFYALFFEKYLDNHKPIGERNYCLGSALLQRCIIDEKDKSFNYYNPYSQLLTFYKFKDEKEIFPYMIKELNKFLYGNILVLPMELFDEEYVRNNFEYVVNNYPNLKKCNADCVPELVLKKNSNEYLLKNCKAKCIPQTIMNRVLDIIIMNIPKQ